MMNKPRLPFKPETIKQCQQRYNASISQIFVCVDSVPNPPPSALRGHVFDSEDGLRLIVSKDRTVDGVFLHVSASIEPNTSLWNALFDKPANDAKQLFKELAMVRFREISGDHVSLGFAGWTSGKGVPHWFRKVTE